MSTTLNIPKRNDGANVRRLRRLMGYDSQAAFAELCGWSQQKMSILERQDIVELADLAVIAEVLDTTVEDIIGFDSASAVSNLQRNSSHDSSTHNSYLNISSTIQRREAPKEIAETIRTLTEVVSELTVQVKDLAAAVRELVARVEGLNRKSE